MMTKQCIEKTIHDIDYQKLFPDMNSLANIWNISGDERDKEESSPNNYSDYSENICLVISKLQVEIGEHINNYYAVTV